MNIKLLIMFLAFILMAGIGESDADTVILKTGEMFQTRKAWKENGVVSYYRNGRLVRVDEREVERLIQSPGQPEAHPPETDRPDAESPSPSRRQPTGQPLPAGDEVGHLGLEWGQAPSPIEGLNPVGVDPAYGGVQLFTKDQRSPHFGRASVDNIFYGFWQGGLYTILVEVSNYLDFTDLKAESFRRYGAGEQEGGALEKYRWVEPASDRLLSFDDNTDTGYLWMRSRAVHEAVRTRYPE